MGKYVTDRPSKNPERSVEKIEAYLRKQGFVKSGRPGKEVWKRMASAILSPEYISVRPGDEHVHLEAWIRAVTPAPRVWVGKANPRRGRRSECLRRSACASARRHRAHGRVTIRR